MQQRSANCNSYNQSGGTKFWCWYVLLIHLVYVYFWHLKILHRKILKYCYVPLSKNRTHTFSYDVFIPIWYLERRNVAINATRDTSQHIYLAKVRLYMK